MIIKKINIVENLRTIITGVVIAVIGVAVAASISKSAATKIKGLNSDILELEKKVVLVKRITRVDAIKKEYGIYLHNDGYALKDIIYDLSRKSGVTIFSLQPPEFIGLGNFIKVSYKIRLNCTYNSLGKFVEGIENIPQFTKIESLEIKPAGAYEGGAILPDEGVGAEAYVVISGYCLRS